MKNSLFTYNCDPQNGPKQKFGLEVARLATRLSSAIASYPGETLYNATCKALLANPDIVREFNKI